MIWAVTQHYADFDVQIRAVLGGAPLAADPTRGAMATITQVFFGGLRPD
jgi:TetR/AcrR family transcriptional regulator